MELAAARGNSGFGPHPIAWQDLRAWAETTGTPITPYEALTLRAMDDAWLSAVNKQKGKKS